LKFSILVLSLLFAAIAAFLLYHRYAHIQRSVREAELAAEQQDVLMPALAPREP